ncbi:glycoside hydrolase family 99-like domain-containing protein [Lysobacter niastensis]|uniref:Glycoside hydrolase family 99-like domain-containing protein n=2 Tax=Lysobacter niastensis TaxID=380629 RepID=A0ABS0BA31_9GAMM|nr:glycoside hydrolase family 99-like domain-containing protein [Lysobacter niastensis]MBF6025871.1 glycoside hydrolase family 99-like domain-containing protein [Lysobacter niastensis]
MSGDAPRARAIAFYLPQFHPIPENDAWWGKGFTEWTNVVSGKPRFEGHGQPHLPADLGFYDLRVPETRQQQADLARAAGIEAFCYYHYWFEGKRLLNRPLDEVLASGEPDFPFCLCWANQTWSRAWSGREHDVLISQGYDEDDHARHIAWLCEVFADPRYLTVDGQPLFLVYLPEDIPDVSRMLDTWRRHCAATLGVAPWFCGVRTGFSKLDSAGLRALGFDGVVEFEPNRKHFPATKNATGHAISLLQRLLPTTWYDALRNSRWLGERNLNTIVDYAAYVDRSLARPPLDDATYPVVFPSWDNTVRRTSATIIENHDAGQYKRWLDDAVARVAPRGPDQRLVFINAWNEWAEGCHLEPDQVHGHAFLDANADALALREVTP